MMFLDTNSEIDRTPITLRLHCRKCDKPRLMQCELVHIISDTNIVKTTCLTCFHSITAPKG